MKEFLKKFIPQKILNFYHYLWAFLSALKYGFPSKKLKIIGVTGTDGKSTTIEMIHKILEEAGYKTASFSSVRIKIGNKEEKNLFKMTMPGRGIIQKFFKKAVNEKCQYAVIEVTSEGILQHRHQFIDFKVAVLTNLKPEHLERHKGFENYKKTKGELFKGTKEIHVINLDDENGEYFLQFPAQKKYGYSVNIKSRASKLKSIRQNSEIFEVRASDIQALENGITFKIQDLDFRLGLIGLFNVYNALAAICVALSQGISLEVCKRALEKLKQMPGRMEIVIQKPFKVIVDYAHTPNALENVYKTIQGIKGKNSKIIGVLGAAGGGRDRWKRPELGKIAAEYCDYIILTNEDPYSENPLKIIEEIESGFSQIPNFLPTGQAGKFQIPNYEKTLDRREAIRKALILAQPGDVVIITGKGCEPWMCVAGDKKIPWDDREIVREEMEKLEVSYK
jgi:UDP-N-acetylmuramoyl-L-alanyl-D-glutamate--2,6-diaminopimelate ligase